MSDALDFYLARERGLDHALLSDPCAELPVAFYSRTVNTTIARMPELVVLRRTWQYKIEFVEPSEIEQLAHEVRTLLLALPLELATEQLLPRARAELDGLLDICRIAQERGLGLISAGG